MTNPNDPAFPGESKAFGIPKDYFDKYPTAENDLKEIAIPHDGLTKREYFAAMALQGILSANFPQGPAQDVKNDSAHYAVVIADALIAELSK